MFPRILPILIDELYNIAYSLEIADETKWRSTD